MKTILSYVIICILTISCIEKSKYSDELGRFLIMFPSFPKVSKKQVNYELGQSIIHSFIYEPINNDDNLSYELYYLDYPKEYVDTLTIDEIYSLFNGGQISNLNDTTLTLMNSTNISIHGHIGREFRWVDKGNRKLSRVRFYLVDNREYILAVNTLPENNFNMSINEFFNSFELFDTTRCKKYAANQNEILGAYYKISFPGKTETRNIETPTIYGNSKSFIEAFQPKLVNDDNLIYMVSTTNFSIDITANGTFNLSKYYEDAIQNVLISRQSSLISKKEITINGIKGIEFKESFKGGEIIILNRIFLHKDRQIGLQVMTIPKNEDNSSMLRFMNSLEIFK